MINKDKSGVKRYNLALQQSLYDELRQEADRQGITFVELARKFFRIGLIVTKAQSDSGATIIIQDEGREKEVIFI